MKIAKAISKMKAEVCAFALGDVGDKIEKVPHEEWSSSQSCLTAGKQGKERLSACLQTCLLYTSPSPRDRTRSRMPSSA